MIRAIVLGTSLIIGSIGAFASGIIPSSQSDGTIQEVERKEDPIPVRGLALPAKNQQCVEPKRTFTARTNDRDRWVSIVNSNFDVGDH